MKARRELWTGLIASLGLVVLILDSKTALSGARDGISLCINSVIPSLFPFFILSMFVNMTFTGESIKPLRPIGKLCGIPEGAESLLLLGLLGGYPVGAQSINEAYKNHSLSNDDAHRLLGFCSNAGPAFIFGMVGGLFSTQKPLWFLWAIQILSALFVGYILPGKQRSYCRLPQGTRATLPVIVEKSIKTMASVCGWVMAFRVVLSFFQRWFLWLFATEGQVAIAGLLELSNGCHALYSVSNQGTRYVMAACFLSFGGLCVAMQTVSVTKDTGTGLYFPGKLIQCGISFLAAYASQYFIFQPDETWDIPVALLLTVSCVIFILPVFLRHRKKVVAIPG